MVRSGIEEECYVRHRQSRLMPGRPSAPHRLRAGYSSDRVEPAVELVERIDPLLRERMGPLIAPESRRPLHPLTTEY